MSKYEPLRPHLESLLQDSWEVPFPEIEKVLGFPFPVAHTATRLGGPTRVTGAIAIPVAGKMRVGKRRASTFAGSGYALAVDVSRDVSWATAGRLLLNLAFGPELRNSRASLIVRT